MIAHPPRSVPLAENPGPAATHVFTARGTTRKMTTDAVAQRLKIHAATAARTCPTIATKNVTPHILRHSCAMRMLAAGIDATTTIALWLGHESPESTRAYLHADLQLKTASPRPHRSATHPPRPLHPARQAARLPRGPLIMPNSQGQTPAPTAAPHTNIGITKTSA